MLIGGGGRTSRDWPFWVSWLTTKVWSCQFWKRNEEQSAYHGIVWLPEHQGIVEYLSQISLLLKQRNPAKVGDELHVKQ